MELANLLSVMDELFGIGNRVGVIVWKNATDNNPSRIVVEHEYVVCYSRDKDKTDPVWKARSLDVKTRLLEVGSAFVRKFPDQERRQREYTAWLRENKPGG